MVKLPSESHGPCRQCGRKGYLGDGLCQRCYDRPPSTSRKVRVQDVLDQPEVAAAVLAERLNVNPRTIWRIRQAQRERG